MERSFMGQNLKKPVTVVKEETPEDFNDSGSGFPWLAKVDYNASSGLITEPAIDGVDTSIRKTSNATSKERFGGGVPASFPQSVLTPSTFVAGTTESWFNIKPTHAATQMTIFYAGSVNVFDAITPEKAQAIMFLAGYGCLSPKMSQSNLQVHGLPAKPVTGDTAFGNHAAPHSSALSSPISVSSHPVGTMGCAVTCGEVKAPENPGISIKLEPSNMMASITSVAASSDVPQFRKASLARFLQKRKERAMNSAPYNLSKKSAGESNAVAGYVVSS